MATLDDKENVAPPISSDPLHRKSTSSPPPLSPKKAGRKGRSKSIGPGSLDDPEAPRLSAKDRRKSAFVPAAKSILSKNEDAERAARRKTMVNRRVSFAPEATLHTWDIIMDHQHDQTTSTDSADSTRRNSGFDGESGSEADAAQEEEDRQLLSPESQQEPKRKKDRRGSAIPPMNFNNPEDAFTTSDISGSEESGSEDEDEDAEGETDDDDTGTAMSLDIDEATVQSQAPSDDSTGSSLTARLRQAADMAGTRGIEYDEFGDVSMEIVENEVTNAMQPWAQENALERIGSAGLDQENVNPFSPAFKAEAAAQEENDQDEEDMSMDVTRAVGGITKARAAAHARSPASDGDGTMDLTQAVGKITGQKRRRSTTDAGSPGTVAPPVQNKRRRSSVARTSMGDETMDLTIAVGGIQSNPSPVMVDRRRSQKNRRSSGMVSDAGDATMDMTRAVGGIKSARSNEADNSFDGNEELSMELTTVLGGIRNGVQAVSKEHSRLETPPVAAPEQPSAATTPKDQERFRNSLDFAATQLLTPILLAEAEKGAKRESSCSTKRKSLSPMRLSVSPSRPQASKNSTPVQTTTQEAIAYPVLPPTEKRASPVKTPTSSPKRRQNRRDVSSEQRQFDVQLQAPEPSPTSEKQQRTSPGKATAITPQERGSDNTKNLTDTIKLMTTPRKEILKPVTPRKQTSPIKTNTPRGRPTPRGPITVLPSPVRRLNEDIQQIKANGGLQEKVGLQDFLGKAGIRFMDLTTTKRRLTTMVPPSKTKSSQDIDAEDITLETGIVAAACTIPELELYQHACHELKRFTKEGKQVILELEDETMKNQPPLIQAYVHAIPERKAALDAQMRDMKTNARLRSKEMWYAWRSQLLDELMGGLSKIGEGLIQDSENLAQSEEILEEALPPLVKQHVTLQQEAEQLEKTVNSVPDDEKEQVEEARTNLRVINGDVAVKRKLLETLRRQVEEQDNLAEHLQDSKTEFTAAIQEASRVREACRGVSLDEITKLKDSVKRLEEQSGWAITSASSNPSTVTMTYRSELQLYFHPRAFDIIASSSQGPSPNSAIGLTYIGDARPRGKKPLPTTLRFFLQLLRASLQGLPQSTTRIPDLLSLVSGGWDTATQVAETERRLGIETLTTSSIVGDERLDVTAEVLLPNVKTKVRATFELMASVNEDDLSLGVEVEPKVMVVYGELYDERNMTKYLSGLTSDGIEGWDDAVRQMRAKLIAKGLKGARK